MPDPKPRSKAPRKPAAKAAATPAPTSGWPWNPWAPAIAYSEAMSKVIGRMLPENRTSAAKIIAEIAAGPQGPGTFAAFDFDGTLVGGYTGAMLWRERQRRKEITRDEIAGTIGVTFKTMARMVEANEMVAHAMAQWAGKSEAEMDELGAHLYENAIQDSVFPEMLEIVEAHRRAGHTIVVATSASRFQAEPTVAALGIEHLLCTQLEVADGKLTGKLKGASMWGEGKAAAISKFVSERQASLKEVHFYADGSEEIGLMQSVGHPHPVNPSGKLADVARKQGWSVLRLSSRGSAKPLDIARGLTGLMSLVPMLYGGVAVGAMTRDKRTIANTVMPAWIDAQLQIAGVKLNVIGRENLWARRPAVFIFNHRNNYDGSFAAALVRTDYTAIAKKDMAKNPIGKLVSMLMPTVFVDRDGDARKAVESLRPVVEAVREGYSLMLAPEGTRMRGNPGQVGPFKKGAFHMAMAAKIPIVPIVIRNALDVASRDGAAMRPGTVDIVVLPPVLTDDWTRANLGEKVEELRTMYNATLQNWPAAEEAA